MKYVEIAVKHAEAEKFEIEIRIDSEPMYSHIDRIPAGKVYMVEFSEGSRVKIHRADYVYFYIGIMKDGEADYRVFDRFGEGISDIFYMEAEEIDVVEVKEI